MLFLTALVLAAVAADARTYRHTDPVTGQMLLCDRCPPGFRLRAHCTPSSRTDCVPCGAGLFTEFWNYIPDCLLCDACADHQRVVRSCNGTANTQCECESGFYWDQHFCKRHSACKPGHGLKAAGTPHRDAVCEVCPDGQFVTRAHVTCVSHSVCGTHEHLLLAGSSWHDNICTTCQQLDNGWARLFDPVLSGLHAQHRIPVSRLQQLVNRRLRKPKRFRKRAARRPADASVELLDFQTLLEDSHLSLLADNIAGLVLSVRNHCNHTL